MKGSKLIILLVLIFIIPCLFIYGCNEDEITLKDNENMLSSGAQEGNKINDQNYQEENNDEIEEKTNKEKDEKQENISSIKNDEEIKDKNEEGDKLKSEENNKKEEITQTEEKDKVNQAFSGNIEGLSNKSIGWSFGGSTDESGRPDVVTAAQEKYKNYNVDFIKENENKIYLTFDEGYENGYTPQILDTLKEKNIKATFFVTMGYVKSQPELVQRMINEGHVIGNHSTSHPEKGMPSLSLAQQKADIMELHNYVKDKFGYEMYLFRYPAGIYSEQSLALVDSIGYRSVFWSFAYADWDPNKQPNEDESLEKLTSKLHPGAIYLLHAVSKTNTNNLSKFIENAQSRGYEFAEYHR